MQLAYFHFLLFMFDSFAKKREGAHLSNIHKTIGAVFKAIIIIISCCCYSLPCVLTDERKTLFLLAVLQS